MRSTACLGILLAACTGSTGTPQPPSGGADLTGFAIESITADGVLFETWIAKTSAARQRGLMNVTPQQMEPLPGPVERGMLFVFSAELFLSFWMRDTFVPLDLAYIRADGTIAEIHPLFPLDETRVNSLEPVQFALEVRAGVLSSLGIGVGDTVVIPPAVAVGAE